MPVGFVCTVYSPEYSTVVCNPGLNLVWHCSMFGGVRVFQFPVPGSPVPGGWMCFEEGVDRVYGVL